MTNINCTLDCIYQIEGKCSYDVICTSTLCTNSECAYCCNEKEGKNRTQTKFTIAPKL